MTGVSVRSVLSRVEAMDDWLLTDAEWAAAGAALDALGTAVAGRSEEGVRAALGDLQTLEESRRAKAQPGPQKSFIPQRQREQRNILVQKLTLELNRDDAPQSGTSAPDGPSTGGPPAEAGPG